MKHRCPANGCIAEVPRTQLACRSHWFSLPAPLRRAINETYRNGPKESHAANVKEAIRLLSEREIVW